MRSNHRPELDVQLDSMHNSNFGRPKKPLPYPVGMFRPDQLQSSLVQP
jgi:hypothetical protein